MLFKNFTIGDKEYTFCACASVNICYRNIFGEDFIKLMYSGESALASSIMQMAFVMAKFGELKDRKKVNQLTEDDYCEWLDEFTTGDLVNALPGIEEFYMQSTAPAVDSKKNSARVNEG